MLFQFAQFIAETLCKSEAHALIAKADVRVVQLDFWKPSALSLIEVARLSRLAQGLLLFP